MNPTINISSETAERVVSAGNIINKEEKSLESFYHKFSEGSYFDSGLLPLDGTGVLSIRKALTHTQIVFQHKPDKYLVTWGDYEHQDAKPTFEVAQPYRIVIGDLIDGNLLGARHFYSPVPVQTGDQVLYHVNLPNLNCKGYKGTSVGWMCLYHTQNWTKDSFDSKVRKLVERASGAEAYNDANMKSTDGARFYQAHRPNYTYLYKPVDWAKKTKDDGVDWVLDTNLWVPVKVAGIDSQLKHDDNGVPLTLEMAMLGKYIAYYSDPLQPKPVNAYARSDQANPKTKSIFDFATAAFVGSAKKSAPVAPQAPTVPGVVIKTLLGADTTSAPVEASAPIWTPPVNYAAAAPVNPIVGSCYNCSTMLHEEDAYLTLQGHKVCAACSDAYYKVCDNCDKTLHFSFLSAYGDNLYCGDCHTVVACKNCGKEYLDDFAPIIEGTHCIDCVTDYQYCYDCQGKFLEQNVHILEAKVPTLGEQGNVQTQTIVLCNDCMSVSVTCACGLVKHQEETGQIKPGVFACETCIDYTEDGTPCYIGKLVSV